MKKSMDELRTEFLHPSAEFTEFPFWFLNGALTEEGLRTQLRDFKAHGIDGVVLHPRLGLTREIEYLSPQYMDLIAYAVEEAKHLSMKVMLYDEAMYPSGAAHGLVVKENPDFAARAIRLERLCFDKGNTVRLPLQTGEEILGAACLPLKDGKADLARAEGLKVAGAVISAPRGMETQTDSCCYAVVAGFSGGTIRGVHFGEDDGEPDAPKAADLLNPEAIGAFLRITYDAYYEKLSKYFGNTVIAFFTDEPSMIGRCVDENKYRPWSKDFLPYYEAQGNQLTDLFALWLDVGEKTAAIRQKFRQTVNKRLNESYYAQLSQWCRMHHCALTGHPASSEDMGCLKYFQLPGQDLVWRWVAPEKELGTTGPNSTLAKCASDAARYNGARRNLDECFGCCGPADNPWGFTVGEMKWYMDWLFVRGTNLLVPHAFLYSVDGEPRYNERPPDVGPNNAWWPYYHIIADYAKRMSWLNTDGYNTTQIAVLCEEDHLPWKCAKPLYEHQIEFNYLDEERLATGEALLKEGKIQICRQAYTVLLLEDEDNLSDTAKAFIQRAEQGGVRVYRDVDLLLCDMDALGIREAELIPAAKEIRVSHQMKDGKDFYLVTNEGERTYSGVLHLGTFGAAERWDAWQGRCEAQPVRIRNGRGAMDIRIHLSRYESVIFVVDPDNVPQKEESFTRRIVECELADGWSREFAGDHEEHQAFLGDWSKEKEYADTYGTAVYRRRLMLPAEAAGRRVWLDLGAVGELAEVFLDGKSVDILLKPPYRAELTGCLQEKPHEAGLMVKVTNSISRRFTKKTRPSGLMGPVLLVCRDEVSS